MNNAIDVANYIVNKSIDIGNPVSNLKLQKLLYYAQAAMLVEYGGEPLFDDKISAWRYGPVVEPVYQRFKIYANLPIQRKVTTRGVDIIEDFFGDNDYEPERYLDPDVRMLIDRVISAYSTSTAIEMVYKTHSEDPWKNASITQTRYILNEDIRTYYQQNRGKIYS